MFRLSLNIDLSLFNNSMRLHWVNPKPAIVSAAVHCLLARWPGAHRPPLPILALHILGNALIPSPFQLPVNRASVHAIEERLTQVYVAVCVSSCGLTMPEPYPPFIRDFGQGLLHPALPTPH